MIAECARGQFAAMVFSLVACLVASSSVRAQGCPTMPPLWQRRIGATRFLVFDNLPLIETAEAGLLDSRDNSPAPAPGSAVGDCHHVDRAGHRPGNAG